MNNYSRIVDEIRKANSIIITSHKSPDGDSIGSSLALLYFIEKLGKKATICHPDPAPDYLNWLGENEIVCMTSNKNKVEELFTEADLIFSLDYNATNRIGEEMQVLLEGSSAVKIMIDHHLNPENYATITVSDTDSCSTAQLIFELIEQSGNGFLLDSKIGTPIYLGILTDTGVFRFPSVQARTHEIIAKLLFVGVKHHVIHENMNDNNTLSRLQLSGYATSEKLEIIKEYAVALVSLTEEEMKRFNYQKGDTDSIANLALSIKGMKAAFFLAEKDGLIKISFRSKGKENPVNVLASEHFSGGGHANASGGISELSMQDTLAKMRTIIPLYFATIELNY